MVVSFCCLIGALLSSGESASVVPAGGFPGTDPGAATARIEGECFVLENAVMAARWELGADRFRLVELTNRMSGTTIRPKAAREPFVVQLEGDRSIKAFVNTTVGTWPSPYWLWYGDSIWRSGRDVGYAGVGSTRQRWLTYRDSIGYKLRTQRGPLYPLNSLKFQSVMCAPLSLAADLSNDPKDLLDDIHMAAASGTQMQEFFVTPTMLTPELWDAVAEAIGWVRGNADVLVDTHGIGGDPAEGEVYGYASWSPRQGIITLRNPTHQSGQITVDVGDVFELPGNAPGRYVVRSRWKEARSETPQSLAAGQSHTLRLAPFEVMVLEATPAE